MTSAVDSSCESDDVGDSSRKDSKITKNVIELEMKMIVPKVNNSDCLSSKEKIDDKCDDDDDDGIILLDDEKEDAWNDNDDFIEEGRYSRNSTLVFQGKNFWVGLGIVWIAITCMYFFLVNNATATAEEDKGFNNVWGKFTNNNEDYQEHISADIFPKELFTLKVYDPKDFFFHSKNNQKIQMIPYWQDVYQSLLHEKHPKVRRYLKQSEPQNKNENRIVTHWGPCYSPLRHQSAPPINWTSLILNHQNQTKITNSNYKEETVVEYPRYHSKSMRGKMKVERYLAGMCRPGFLIIGAGKCGTSSLYHYLVDGHPRILPASEKQIHYFKYNKDQSMQWYLSHFPTTQYFLSHGALMTGEASPGYLPYLNIPHRIHKIMSGLASTSTTDFSQKIETSHNSTATVATTTSVHRHNNDLPKMIAIIRNPLTRAYSSYRYNYVQPAREYLREFGTPEGYDEDAYLFSFQDLMQAEIERLEECLKPGGLAEQMATKKINKNKHLKKQAITLMDLEGGCYNNYLDDLGIPRIWDSLRQKYPRKVVSELVGKHHLIRSLIGRSLYVLALNWWYAEYTNEDDIYIVCTEELKEDPVTTMSQVTSFLGLPPYNFTEVVSKGLYNVGGESSTGYDTVTPWSAYQQSSAEDQKSIPLDKDFEDKFWKFVQPYTDDLTQLIGKKCPHW